MNAGGICITAAAGYEPTDPRYYPFVIIDNNTKYGTRTTLGVPPILVEKDKLCEECHNVHDIEVCPICGEHIYINYGFMGGGLGEYYVCGYDKETDCPWIYKILDPLE